MILLELACQKDLNGKLLESTIMVTAYVLIIKPLDMVIYLKKGADGTG
jgi:hypothetical protein